MSHRTTFSNLSYHRFVPYRNESRAPEFRKQRALLLDAPFDPSVPHESQLPPNTTFAYSLLSQGKQVVCIDKEGGGETVRKIDSFISPTEIFLSGITSPVSMETITPLISFHYPIYAWDSEASLYRPCKMLKVSTNKATETFKRMITVQWTEDQKKRTIPFLSTTVLALSLKSENFLLSVYGALNQKDEAKNLDFASKTLPKIGK